MTGYVLEVELELNEPAGEDLVDELMTQLADVHATIGAPPATPAHALITMTVEAAGPRQAVDEGLARVEKVGALVGYSVTPEELRDQRADLGADFLTRTVSVPEAASMAGVSRQTMFRWVHDGTVRAHQISDKSWVLDRGSVEALVREREARDAEREARRRVKA